MFINILNIRNILAVQDVQDAAPVLVVRDPPPVVALPNAVPNGIQRRRLVSRVAPVEEARQLPHADLARGAGRLVALELLVERGPPSVRGRAGSVECRKGHLGVLAP